MDFDYLNEIKGLYVSERKIDPNKKNILFVFAKGKNYSCSNGIYQILDTLLKDQYNIFYISTYQMDCPNCFAFTNHFRENFGTETKENENLLNNLFSALDLPDFDLCLYFEDRIRLPFMGYAPKDSKYHNLYNKFTDSIYETDDEWKELVNKIKSNIMHFTRVTSFMFCNNAVAFKLFDFLKLHHKYKKVISFVIDPEFFYQYIDSENTELLYFADDNRGTRHFKKFDIGQFHHILYDNYTLKLNNNYKKTKDLIFAGNVFAVGSDRDKMFEIYLENISHNVDLFIPNAFNDINHSKTNDRSIKNAKEKFSEIYDRVVNNKNYKGYLQAVQLPNEMNNYRYGLILPCYTYYDSLNFRPVFYVYHWVLPFIAPGYDPEYLMIPKEIQDRITVKNSTDIDNLIDYYNDHEDERIEIIKKLRDIFEIDEYIQNPEKMINREMQKILPEYTYQHELSKDKFDW